jgi:alpha-N-acetylglucosaminidase
MQDNICTPGYTTAYFGWPEWERYLDVMALHGYNLTMAPLGGEAIWARVWKRFGVTDAELADFFTGPAFLPWHRMGNVNKHGGPVPASYFEQSVALQKKLLARMRALGIEPVAPAFSGFVPAGFKRAQPSAQVLAMRAWCGFGGAYGSHMLHPLSPLYPEIGGAFIQEWQQEFGSADFYQADSFNEMHVPVSGDRTNQLAQLAAFGDSVYSAIKAGDPDGTWVMMAWAFLDAGFWTPDNTKALLSRVPDDRMLILDLFCERHPQWNRLNAYFGKPWTFGVLPNFGGNGQYIGNLGYLARTLPALTSLTNRGNLSAFGYFPEGTENNEVLYELASDAIWSRGPLDVEAWLQGYGRARYGALPAPVREAWTLLAQSVYARGDGSVNQWFQRRPAGGSYGAHWTGDSRLQQAADRLIEAAPALRGNPLFVNDAIEVSAQSLGMLVDQRLQAGQSLLKLGATNEAARCFADATGMLGEMDRLLASHTLWRLDRWVGLARAWGSTPAERDYFEQDAKRQVTIWGSGGAALNEYAAKVWSGLVGGYYRGRWEAWSEAALSGRSFDVNAWQEDWIRRPVAPPTAVWPEPLAEAARLLAVARAWDSEGLLRRAEGGTIGVWRSGEMSETYADRDWEVTALVDAGTCRVRFVYTGGSHRLDIARVALLVNGAEVAADEHEGTTGVRNEGNSYTLEVRQPVPAGAKVTLRARIKSAGGTDSNGTVFLGEK